MAGHPQVRGRTCSITLNAFLSRAAVMGDADAIYMRTIAIIKQQAYFISRDAK
jgi:hypothetical protein